MNYKWKKIFLKLRQIWNEKIVMSVVTIVLLLMVLLAATTAWYTANNEVRLFGLTLKTGGTGGLKVAVEPGGEDIDTFTEKTTQGVPIIPLKLSTFENIESGKIAPGFYSPMDFYVTPLAPTVTGCQIKVKINYKNAAGAEIKLTTEQRNQLESYVKQHIRVYKTMTVSGTDAIFSDPLTYFEENPDSSSDGTGADFQINYGQENKVSLYWYWSYEYPDMPGAVASPTNEQIRQYDEEDTMIGNYIDNVYFDFYIVGTAG